jgi:hypothetical protein
VVELPKPPWYRRFEVIFLAANLAVVAVLVAAAVALWPRAAQRPHARQRPRGWGTKPSSSSPKAPSQRRS